MPAEGAAVLIALQPITRTLGQCSTRHAGPATTLATLVWALLQRPRLGMAAIGRALAAATGATAQHTIKRGDWCLGNPRRELQRAQGEEMRHEVRGPRPVRLALDGTDAHDGVYQILALGVRVHGRAIPLAWETGRKDQLRDRQRATEQDLCRRVAAASRPGVTGSSWRTGESCRRPWSGTEPR